MGNTNQQPVTAKDEGRSHGSGQRKEQDPKESHGLVNKITGRQRRREVASIDFKLNTLFPWRNKGSAALRNEQRKVLPLIKMSKLFLSAVPCNTFQCYVPPIIKTKGLFFQFLNCTIYSASREH